MDQSKLKIQNQASIEPPSVQRRIAYIQAGWHGDIVGQAFTAFEREWESDGLPQTSIDRFDVPGSLEIPLQAKLLANSGDYSIIVACGLIVDGGIYRHDFVAATVLDAMMQVQLQSEIPILSVVLTPHQFQETEAHRAFFIEHFQVKGREAAQACRQTMNNLEPLRAA